MTTPVRSRHERFFRLLLRLYPWWFRDAYADEMAAFFRARLERCTSPGDVARLWWKTVKDAVATAAALRRRGSGEGGLHMGTLWQDIRYAARHLGRSPAFTMGAVALLAVGIGANTTVFTVVDGLLFRPPPWTNPEEVVHVYQDSDDGEPSSNSYPATQDMARSDVFASVAATSQSSAAWEGPDGPVTVSTEYTTSSYMEVLGMTVQRGRWFGPEHDAVGSELVAVVSAPAWHSRFGGDPGVVGRTIRLNGQPVTIIGVGPEGLSSTAPPLVTDFWLSISSTPVGGSFQVANLERREDHWYQVLARLAPGVSVAQAQSAMDALATRLAEAYPEFNRGREITVFASADVRQHPQGDGSVFLVGSLLSAVVLTILLLACANLANLLLVRGLSRSGEVAVRAALGASRGRVARLFLIESFLLSAMGGLAGVLLARWSLAVLPAVLPLPVGAALDLRMDARVGVYSTLLMVATGFLFGLGPALRSARLNLAQVLRDDRRGASGARGPARLRGVLVAVQVAASLILVLGAGLLARSLAAVQGADTGVDADHVAYLRIDWTLAGLAGDEARVVTEELLARLRSTPGVEGAAAASRLPAGWGGSTTTEVEGYEAPSGTQAVELPFAIVSDTYFETMGIRLVAGRLFNEDDGPGGGGTSIIINETAAHRFWGNDDPIGRRMRGQGAEEWTRTVVGVVSDAPVASLNEAPRPYFYFSTRQVPYPPGYIVARTPGDPADLVGLMRQALTETRPTLAVSAEGTLVSHFGASLAVPRFAAAFMGAFSLLALFLAGLGIYAVVSFSVAGRTSELGIRMALGAERSGVVRMVVREVVGVVSTGLVVGLAVAIPLAWKLGGLLSGVGALDPVTFAGAVAVLLVVAWIAAYVPARRAALADPVDALRTS